MDLYTRCSNCQTAFRVTTQQLQASGGQVRCGHCESIFDAFATLTAQEPQRLHVHPGPSDVQSSRSDSYATESGPKPISPGLPISQKDNPQPLRPDPAASLYEWEFRMPNAPRRTLLHAILALILSSALAAQAALAFRPEVTMLLPQTSSYYTRICEFLGCPGGPLKESNYLHIEASDLKTVDPSHANEIQLLLSVRNRAPVDLAYPAFELTLTNALEQAVGRRVFQPAEYLPPEASRGGLKAGTELPIQLYLDTGALRAIGYRLYLFYP
jgi:predicted Zn finger-like uncharacterized protein